MQKPINNQELVNMQNETTMKIPTITTTQQIPNTSLTNFQINYETYNQIATQQRNKNFLQMYYSLYMNKIAWINYQNQNAQNQNMAMSILLNAANQEQAMQTILRNNYFNSL